MLASHDEPPFLGVLGLSIALPERLLGVTAGPPDVSKWVCLETEGLGSLLEVAGDLDLARSIRCGGGPPGTLVPQSEHSRPFLAHTPQYGHFIFSCFEGSNGVSSRKRWFSTVW